MTGIIDLAARRQFFAEEVEATSNLKSRALVAGLAALPREQFLPPGPWTVRADADFMGPPRQTPDADPRHVYHNLSIAIDARRQLFNGAPGFVAMVIDRLGLAPGDRVLHIGCGTGYYTALIAGCVGPSGRVLAIDVDEALATAARENLAASPWVEVRCGDGAGQLDGQFDAILVNAGVTHPLDAWLDALSDRGHMALPLTAAMSTSPPISKGLMLLLARGDDPMALSVRTVSFVSIYSAVGVRDERANDQLAAAMKRNPFPVVERLRRDPHDEGPSCWLHGATCCFSRG